LVRKALPGRKVLAGAGSVAGAAIDRVAADKGSAVFVSVNPISVVVAVDGRAAVGMGGAPATKASDFAGTGDAFKATVAFPVEDVFAAEVGAGVAESEAGVDAEAGVNPCPSFTRTRARADGPKKANNMAAMASLTSLP
jgi:hypothetical protein